MAPQDFKKYLEKHHLKLTRVPLKTLQLNLGRLCNQSCKHCHVEAGFDKKEVMQKNTIDRLLALIKDSPVQTIDLTGGAPELNPHFRHIVSTCHKFGKEIIVRCNLTVLFEPSQQDTPHFFKENKVQVTASLPCYMEQNVDTQRGSGIFKKSIKGLKLLNNIGYGIHGTNLNLSLVYNPTGPFLPPAQGKLEIDYHEYLKNNYGVYFNDLYTITNMPVGRFAKTLKKTPNGAYQNYMELLKQNFNADAAKNIMCRSLISISWDGQIYDCDFNQMLDKNKFFQKKTIWDIENLYMLENNEITFANHCFGCTAGNGSSCKGVLA